MTTPVIKADFWKGKNLTFWKFSKKNWNFQITSGVKMNGKCAWPLPFIILTQGQRLAKQQKSTGSWFALRNIHKKMWFLFHCFETKSYKTWLLFFCFETEPKKCWFFFHFSKHEKWNNFSKQLILCKSLPKVGHTRLLAENDQIRGLQTYSGDNSQ